MRTIGLIPSSSELVTFMTKWVSAMKPQLNLKEGNADSLFHSWSSSTLTLTGLAAEHLVQASLPDYLFETGFSGAWFVA